MNQYFPKPYELSGTNTKVELDISNYPTKADLKGTAGVDTSNLTGKSDLAALKAEVGKIDLEKLKTVPENLSKLSYAVGNGVVQRTVYDKLATKVNSIKILSSSGLFTGIQYDSEKKMEDVNKNIPSVTGLIINIALNTKATDIENKIPDLINLTAKAALNTKATHIENTIPDTSHFINHQEFNRLTKQFRCNSEKSK